MVTAGKTIEEKEKAGKCSCENTALGNEMVVRESAPPQPMVIVNSVLRMEAKRGSPTPELLREKSETGHAHEGQGQTDGRGRPLQMGRRQWV